MALVSFTSPFHWSHGSYTLDVESMRPLLFLLSVCLILSFLESCCLEWDYDFLKLPEYMTLPFLLLLYLFFIYLCFALFLKYFILTLAV